MPDMNRHGIIRPDRLFVPDVFIDLVDGKDLALILYKQEENIVLRRVSFTTSPSTVTSLRSSLMVRPPTV